MFLAFVKVGESKSGLTNIWQVQSKQTNCLLGEISWFANWRKYVFKPTAETLFDATCLNEIKCFLTAAMIEHKAK